MICVEGSYSPLSYIFFTPVPSLVGLYDVLDKRVTYRIHRLNRQLDCSFGWNAKVGIEKLMALEKKDVTQREHVRLGALFDVNLFL